MPSFTRHGTCERICTKSSCPRVYPHTPLPTSVTSPSCKHHHEKRLPKTRMCWRNANILRERGTGEREGVGEKKNWGDKDGQGNRQTQLSIMRWCQRGGARLKCQTQISHFITRVKGAHPDITPLMPILKCSSQSKVTLPWYKKNIYNSEHTYVRIKYTHPGYMQHYSRHPRN